MINRFWCLFLLNYFAYGIDIKQGELTKTSVNPYDLSKIAKFSFSTGNNLLCNMQCIAKVWCQMACLEDSLCNLYDYSIPLTLSTPLIPCYLSSNPTFSLVENLNVHWLEQTPKSTRKQVQTPLIDLENCLGRCLNQDSFVCTTVCVTNTECVETDMMLDPKFDEASVYQTMVEMTLHLLT